MLFFKYYEDCDECVNGKDQIMLIMLLRPMPCDAQQAAQGSAVQGCHSQPPNIFCFIPLILLLLSTDVWNEFSQRTVLLSQLIRSSPLLFTIIGRLAAVSWSSTTSSLGSLSEHVDDSSERSIVSFECCEERLVECKDCCISIALTRSSWFNGWFLSITRTRSSCLREVWDTEDIESPEMLESSPNDDSELLVELDIVRSVRMKALINIRDVWRATQGCVARNTGICGAQHRDLWGATSIMYKRNMWLEFIMAPS